MSGRMAEPEEIADVIFISESKVYDYQIINVDGGFSSW